MASTVGESGVNALYWGIAIFTVILTVIYKYLTRNFSFWKKQGIKGPKPVPFFGTFVETFKKPAPDVEIEWYKKYGRIYGRYLGNIPSLAIAEPDLIKNILVKDFNLFRNRILSRFPGILNKSIFFAHADDWKRIRTIATPAFTSGKMKKMYGLIRSCLDDFIHHLEQYAIKGKELDIKSVYAAFTMDVIARCGFATKTNTHVDPNEPFIKNGVALLNQPFWRVIMSFIIPRSIQSYVMKLLKRNSPDDFFANVARHLLRERKNETGHNDFLQLLTDAYDDGEQQEEDDSESHHVNEGKEELKINNEVFRLSGNVAKKLTEDEICAQVVLFFIAGFETTATTLSYCTYELSLNPSVQDKLYKEIAQAVDSKGEIDYDTLAKLPYLDATLSETLRKYPPVQTLNRVTDAEYKLGDTGITLAKDQVVEIPVYAIHHDPENYPNPDKFNPERFLPENRANLKPYTYLPFGAGPRNCIGMRFALLEAKLGLAHLIHKYEFFRSPKTDVPVRFKKRSGSSLLQCLKIETGIRMRA